MKKTTNRVVTDTIEKQYYTTREVAHIVGVHRDTIISWHHQAPAKEVAYTSVELHKKRKFPKEAIPYFQRMAMRMRSNRRKGVNHG